MTESRDFADEYVRAYAARIMADDATEKRWHAMNARDIYRDALRARTVLDLTALNAEAHRLAAATSAL
jgi:hypothetical protein